MLQGMDVSDWNPGTIWSTVVQTQKFAYIKATEGTDIGSDTFASDWAGAKAAGVPRGAYHYLHPDEDARSQAAFFLSTVGTLGMNDLPPMLDWEETDGTTNTADIAAAQTWLTVVEEATGRTPIIYTGPDFYNALGNPTQFFHYPLFIADWYETCPSIPPPWNTWLFWQYDPNGTVNGVQGSETDLDWFNGSSL
jgi:lysozyme